MSDSTIPPKCPGCGDRLIVVRLQCSSCGTEVNGEFDVCPVCTLEGRNRELFDLFMESRGNLKEVQRKLGISYPTVRQRIDSMFSELKGEKPSMDPAEVLKKLSKGEIDVETASKLIAGE
ncbi:DUF2089 domain-containing protein [Candidatus Fermentibacteria bacterium]|nr:MAG: DUF2089 domain-containing protein [Candidatus Fermentibacteria bacterium]